MLRVPIKTAKPGMVLALAIYHPRRRDTTLLKEGITLDARSIQRLAEIHLREIWVRFPGGEFICDYICPATYEAQAELTWQIACALEHVTRGAFARLEYSAYRGAINAVVGRLVGNPRAALFIQELVGREEPALRHASNVCLLSLLMGLKLDDYLIAERSRLDPQDAREVSSLGVGAMFHDVGMLRLDPAVVERWNRTLDESDPAWRRHVAIGHEMVKDCIGAAAAAGVLHHHQKFDGTGFPSRPTLSGLDEPVAGSDIHIFARIIACADLYDRLRHPPGAAETAGAAPVVRVLKRMQESPYRRWLDPMVFRALLTVVPAYAPGTIVGLSNGVRGVVADWFPDDPCRPTVMELGEGDDLLAATDRPRRRYVLRDDSRLTVVEAEGQDVSADNFFPTSPGQFDLRLAGKALMGQLPPRPVSKAG